MKRIGFGALMTLALAFGAAGCGDSTNNNNNPDLSTPGNPDMTQMQAGTAKVRIVHAAINVGPVNITAGGATLNGSSPLAFGQKTGYLEVPAGAAIDATVTPTAQGAQGVPVTVPALTKDTKTTILAIGDAAQGATNGFRVLAVTEDFPSSGINLRVVHASPDAPAVGLQLASNPAPTSAGLPFGQVAKLDGLPTAIAQSSSVPVGIYAGASAPLAKVTSFTIPTTGLVSLGSTNIFVVATGSLTAKQPDDAEGFQLLAFSDSETSQVVAPIKQDPVVYVLHASPTTGAVDVLTGTTTLLPNVPYGGFAGIQTAPASSGVPLSVKVLSNNATVGPVTSPALEAGKRYLAIAAGGYTPSGGTAKPFGLVFVADELANPPANKLRVRAVHASADAPGVDVGVYNGSTFTKVATLSAASGGLEYTNASSPAAGAELDPATTLPVAFAAAGQTTIAARVPVPGPAGARAYAVAGGRFDQATTTANAESFGLFLIATSNGTISTATGVAPTASAAWSRVKTANTETRPSFPVVAP